MFRSDRSDDQITQVHSIAWIHDPMVSVVMTTVVMVMVVVMPFVIVMDLEWDALTIVATGILKLFLVQIFDADDFGERVFPGFDE